jgi:hypothetical protein
MICARPSSVSGYACSFLQLRDPLFDRPLRPPDLPEHIVHLLLERRDLFEPDLVNLVRRQIGCRVPPERVRVRFVAAFESPQPRVIVCLADQRLEEGDAALPCGIHLRGDNLLDLSAQLLATGVGDSLRGSGTLIERRDERILRRRCGDELLHLRDGRADDEARRDHLLCNAGTGLGDRFVHPRAHLTQAGDVEGGVSLRVQRMADDEQIGQVDVRAAELLERERVVVVLLALDERAQLPLHQVG